jgi:hypothetical protein
MANSHTVPCKVEFRNRQVTDIVWGVINLLFYLGFLISGIIVASRSVPRHRTLDDFTRGLSEYYMEDAATCCLNNNNQGYVCMLYADTVNGGGRRLSAGSSKFDGDEGIFDAFIEAPGIIIGILSVVLAVSVLWVVLLRFFAKPVVIIVEMAKIALMISLGIYQQETSTRIMCFVFAVLMVAYVAWQWKTIMFAAKIITHSTISLKENPSILVGSLATKLIYAGNAALFVLFYAKSFDVVDIQSIDGLGCDFFYPAYIGRLSIFWSLAYLWTLLLIGQMRLSIIATIVGSWHFHPEDMPGLFVAMKNVFTSFGTLSISSLIATVAEKVNRMMSEGFWKSVATPLFCVTVPLQCFLCCFGTLIQGCIRMLTNYAVVLHVFTGEGFVGSARNSFNILSRHFEGGFVTEYTSRSLFSLASYAFSFCIALITWVWIDAEFQADSLPRAGGDENIYLWVLYILVILGNVYYPVLGLYIMIIANKFLRDWERQKMNSLMTGDDDFASGTFFTEPTNHFWIPPLAGTFVGCLSMMFFTFLSSMFLDIITTLFLCFAIDKDNNVDMSSGELDSLMKEMPNYIESDTSTLNQDDLNDPEVPGTPVAIPVQAY